MPTQVERNKNTTLWTYVNDENENSYIQYGKLSGLNGDEVVGSFKMTGTEIVPSGFYSDFRVKQICGNSTLLWDLRDFYYNPITPKTAYNLDQYITPEAVGLGGEELWLCPTLNDSANDLSAYSRHGSYSGGMGTVVNTERGGQKAYQFDGSNDWIDIPSFWQHSGQVTLSFWMKRYTNSKVMAIGGTNDFTPDRFTFYINAGGSAFWDNWGPDTFTGSRLSVPSSSSGEWINVQVESSGYHDVSMTAYYSGVQVATKAGSDGPRNLLKWVVGTYYLEHSDQPDSGAFFSGLMDDIRIYKRGLSTVERAKLASKRGYSEAVPSGDFPYVNIQQGVNFSGNPSTTNLENIYLNLYAIESGNQAAGWQIADLFIDALSSGTFDNDNTVGLDIFGGDGYTRTVASYTGIPFGTVSFSGGSPTNNTFYQSGLLEKVDDANTGMWRYYKTNTSGTSDSRKLLWTFPKPPTFQYYANNTVFNGKNYNVSGVSLSMDVQHYTNNSGVWGRAQYQDGPYLWNSEPFFLPPISGVSQRLDILGEFDQDGAIPSTSSGMFSFNLMYEQKDGGYFSDLFINSMSVNTFGWSQSSLSGNVPLYINGNDWQESTSGLPLFCDGVYTASSGITLVTDGYLEGVSMPLVVVGFGGQLSGIVPMFAKSRDEGIDYGNWFGQMPLYTYSVAESSGDMILYTIAAGRMSGNSSLNLSIPVIHAPSANSGISLVVPNVIGYEQSGVNLFTKAFLSSGTDLKIYCHQQGIFSGVSLYTFNSESINNSVPLFVGGSQTSGWMNLFSVGGNDALGQSGNFPLYLNSTLNDSIGKGMPLFTYSILGDSLNLFTQNDGEGPENSDSIPLFVRGFQDGTLGSIPLVAYNNVGQSGKVMPIFLQSAFAYSGNSSMPLFVGYGSGGPENAAIPLYCGVLTNMDSVTPLFVEGSSGINGNVLFYCSGMTVGNGFVTNYCHGF